MKKLLLLISVAAAVVAYAQSTRTLQLPDVPDSLRDIPSRAEYVVLHYWDNMDFSDSTAVADEYFMEQSFADYAGILPIAPDSVIPKAAGEILSRLEQHPFAYRTFLDLAAIYLFEYDSPLRYEQAYLPFLKKALEGNVIDSATRLRYEFTLDEIQKNSPGTKISDIQVITADSRQLPVSQVLPDAPYIILLLFDPECSHCVDLIEAIDDDPIISAALQSKNFAITAVNIMGPEAAGENARLIPTAWTALTAVDTEFNDTEAFALPSLPVIYLIDKDMTVILKEVNPQQLIKALKDLQN